RTPKMFKEEFFTPKILNKEDPNQWQNTGSKSLFEGILEEKERRLAAYNAPKLTSDQENLVNQYIPAMYRETI
ncbi:MAG: trimethylamine methyltransferase family protein, partial [Eubacterium sp.]